jgi:hypothetical protein
LSHKVVAYCGLGVALLGAAIISIATEGAKETDADEGRAVPAPA